MTVALFLNKDGVKTTIYESRSSNANSPGALMLSPNALRTLDAIGVYERIRTKGYNFQTLTFNNDKHKFLDAYYMGSEKKYGYDALRIYRQVLLDELHSMVKEAGIEIQYETKFDHVVSESDSSITFALADGEERTVDLLIGADGIHSRVRRYMLPDIKPAYQGVMEITAHIATNKVKLPFDHYPMPVSIHSKTAGFVMAPQDEDGSSLLCGTQYRYPEQTREGWDALWSDKEKLLSLMKETYDDWDPMVQSAMDAIPLDSLSIWAFHSVPTLPTWRSEKGRVIILGDAAHAIPPAAGQGVNQAFEDAQSLTLLMAAVAREPERDWRQALDWWQQYRQGRLERVTDLTNEMSKRRLPGWSGAGGKSIDSSWLFNVRVEEDVKRYLDSN